MYYTSLGHRALHLFVSSKSGPDLRMNDYCLIKYAEIDPFGHMYIRYYQVSGNQMVNLRMRF